MQFHKTLDDRKSDAEAAMSTRNSRIRLTEAIEDERQEVRFDSDAGVLDSYLHMGVDTFEDDFDATAFGRELHGIAEQIPKYLLQARRIATHWSDLGVDQCLDANGSVVCRRSYGIYCMRQDVLQARRMDLQHHLTRYDPTHVEQVIDDLGLNPDVARDRLQTAVEVVPLRPCLSQQLGPSLDRVQWRSQFMRQSGQKLVLEPTHPFGLSPGGPFGLQKPLSIGD